jgi:TM2 domain-containing membrane protein YozV
MSTKLQEAITAIKSGDKETGKQLLVKILETDSRNEDAWLWMTQVVSSKSERIRYLENVLRINPDNETAKRGLAQLQQKQIEPVSLKPIRPLKSLKDTKKCPYCAETIKIEAKICRFCSRDLVTGQPPQSAIVQQSQPSVIVQAPSQRLWSPGIAALLSLFIPGTGQIYKGQVGKGLLHLVVILGGYALFIIPGLILHVLCIIDATQGDPYKQTGSASSAGGVLIFIILGVGVILFGSLCVCGMLAGTGS